MHYSKKLGLNPFEILFTLKEKRGALWNALIGLTAIVIAGTSAEWLAGVCYLFIPIVLILNERLFKIALKKANLK